MRNNNINPTWYVIIIFILGLFFFTQSAKSENITGVANVIDGDTIRVNGRSIRLMCIDAPETSFRGYDQACIDKKTNCGKKSTAFLAKYVHGSDVACTILKKDRYNRDLGFCFANFDIQEYMLTEGYAIYAPYGNHKHCNEYQQFYKDAITEKRGLWKWGFHNPYDWRHNKQIRETYGIKVNK